MRSHRSDKAKSDKNPTARISRVPLKDLRGTLARTGQPKKAARFVSHGMEESPDEARARFHSELLDRVRIASTIEHPMPENTRAELLNTIDVWEQSLWSAVDETTRNRNRKG